MRTGCAEQSHRTPAQAGPRRREVCRLLPPGLSKSIEGRLRAEQAAQQMVYVLQRERREAERKLVEAEGNRDANRKLAEGLTPAVLRYKAIEALHELARSPNAKLIITSDENPRGLDTDDLFARVAGLGFEGRVDVPDGAVGGGDDDGLRGRIDNADEVERARVEATPRDATELLGLYGLARRPS
jgi:hypothetical protein